MSVKTSLKKSRQDIGTNEDLNNFHLSKSTSFIEAKKSRISTSFLKTGNSTMISYSSNSNTKKQERATIRQTNEFFIKEYEMEDSESSCSNEEVKADYPLAKKIITFSAYISNAPWLDPQERGKPLLIKENIETSSNDSLIFITRKFLAIINESIQDKSWQFNIPSEDTSLAAEYTVKPMKKKNGKPDLDLPGFEPDKMINELNHDSFSIVFEHKSIKQARKQIEKQSPLKEVIVSTQVPINSTVIKEKKECCDHCILF